jgi:L-alanine-DL-glutamate epimerase-like enolase superfamily enzyme
MKMNMGDKPAKVEVERMKAVREAVGEDVDIMVDVTWSWTVSQAIQIGHQLEPYNLYWLEDPIPTNDIDGLAQITSALDVPVTTGENLSTVHGFRPLLERKGVDIVMIDLQFVGGITEWMKVATMAQAWNLPVVSHLFNEFSPHLIASIPNGLITEYMPWWDVIYQEPPKVKDGYIKIPNKPGLGWELDLEVIKKYRIQ